MVPALYDEDGKKSLIDTVRNEAYLSSFKK